MPERVPSKGLCFIYSQTFRASKPANPEKPWRFSVNGKVRTSYIPCPPWTEEEGYSSFEAADLERRREVARVEIDLIKPEAAR